MKNLNEQLKIIRRGAVEIISEDELVKKLERSIRDNKPLRIKAGFDPTAPDIHLGHTVLLRKLRQFQDLGHKVVFLIGDFTARIGDPSGRSEIRKQLDKKEVLKNAETYKKQVGKVLDLKRLEVAFNSKWFDKMQGLEFGQLLTHYTVNQLLEREDFALRRKEQKPLYMSEFIYPVFQGYDSVMLKSDIEIGGTDQIFNLLVGRELQKDFGQEQQVVMTMPLLEGTDGVKKMSKSYGNYIGINESPHEMFGKVMSIADQLMLKYYELLTDEDLEIARSAHPKEAKERLAELIIASYHGAKKASEARDEFKRVFSHKELPQDMPVYRVKAGENILSVLLSSKLITSGNEARRLIKQSAIMFNDKKVDSDKFVIETKGVLKVGSRRFLKIEL